MVYHRLFSKWIIWWWLRWEYEYCLYNTLSQVVAYYNKPDNTFVGYGSKGGASYSMYSLTNGGQNLRMGSFVANSSLDETTNKVIEISIAPNPADEIIKISFFFLRKHL